jgi:hypothetical protein
VVQRKIGADWKISGGISDWVKISFKLKTAENKSKFV